MNSDTAIKYKNRQQSKREVQLPLVENLPEYQFCSDKILAQRNTGMEVRKLLNQINEIFFLCESCGQLKKKINFDLIPDKKTLRSDEEDIST